MLALNLEESSESAPTDDELGELFIEQNFRDIPIPSSPGDIYVRCLAGDRADLETITENLNKAA